MNEFLDMVCGMVIFVYCACRLERGSGTIWSFGRIWC